MSQVLTITAANFPTEVEKAAELVLVDFGAEWCPPCRMLAPIIEGLAQEFAGQPVKIGKVDIDQERALAGQFGIMSVPTMLFFKGGQRVDHLVGFHAAEDIKKKIADRM